MHRHRQAKVAKETDLEDSRENPKETGSDPGQLIGILDSENTNRHGKLCHSVFQMAYMMNLNTRVSLQIPVVRTSVRSMVPSRRRTTVTPQAIFPLADIAPQVLT